MKRRIRLTESQLHRVIKESVRRILREESFGGDSSSEEDILIVNEDIFGDEEEHELTMRFGDGKAYDVNGEYVLDYPTMDEVLSSEEMQDEIEEYIGREVGDYFDIALKYGVLHRL